MRMGSMYASGDVPEGARPATVDDRGREGRLRLAANLTLLFTELPFLDRFGAAADCGFTAVECQFPYAHAIREIGQRLRTHRLQLVLHNLPAGDWAAGERGIACHPDRHAEFLSGVALAIEYATELACPLLNCLAGRRPREVSAAQAAETLRANVTEAAARCASAGLGLVIEPINTKDVPEFFLSRTEEALALVDTVGGSRVSLQYDAYHAHVMGDDIVSVCERTVGRIGHVQIADNPGRHEPGTGSMPFERFFAALDRGGYAGWVGCEYNPIRTTRDGLGWAAPYLAGRTK